MKRGQVNQVFIYVIASIIFAVVMIFGYNAVTSIGSKMDYIALVEFKTKVESKINSIASTQDKLIEEFRIPGNYDQLCFIDMTKGGYYNCESDSLSYCWKACKVDKTLPGQICNAWKDNISQSVFLLPYGELPIKTAKIKVMNESGAEVGGICIDLPTATIKLQLTGEGDKTKIQHKAG